MGGRGRLYSVALAHSCVGTLQIFMRAAKSLIFLLGLGVGVARAEVELVGVMRDGTKTHVLLRDTAAGWASDWVTVGGRARGYELVEYKAQGEVLVLRREGRTIEVPLRKGAVRTGEPAEKGGMAELTHPERLRMDITVAGAAEPIVAELRLGQEQTILLPGDRILTVTIKRGQGARDLVCSGTVRIRVQEGEKAGEYRVQSTGGMSTGLRDGVTPWRLGEVTMNLRLL